MGLSRRLELHEFLCDVLGSRNVYFQPPATTQMKYPAIVYSRSRINNLSADNDVYIQDKRYQLIVIDSNPDSEIVERISKLPTCQHDRQYKSENLNHDVFTIYF